jgi:hypothetical protein
MGRGHPTLARSCQRGGRQWRPRWRPSDSVYYCHLQTIIGDSGEGVGQLAHDVLLLAVRQIQLEEFIQALDRLCDGRLVNGLAVQIRMDDLERITRSSDSFPMGREGQSAFSEPTHPAPQGNPPSSRSPPARQIRPSDPAGREGRPAPDKGTGLLNSKAVVSSR